jgi:hypothetical protein
MTRRKTATTQKVCLDVTKYNSIINQNAKLEDRINKITNSLHKKPVCDEECQANKLKQIYLQSQQNLLTAPQKEQIAYKNYVVFTEGELAYTEQETQQYTLDAEEIEYEIITNFEKTAKQILIAIESYDSLLLNYTNILELYKKYIAENKALIRKLKNNSSDVITNDRKTYYEDQGISSLNFYYNILIVIYIIVVICFGIFAFGYQSSLSVTVKIVIFVIFLILPFISTKILNLIIEFLHKIYDFLPKNSYTTL